MKTQISRRRRTPFRDYSGVYQQQGRLLSDADWNELTDIEKARLAAALSQAVASGTPRHGGLRVTGEPPAILPGWVVVEGHLGRHADMPEEGAPVPLAPDAQTDYAHAPAWSPANRVLYVDVWERAVTALEDDSLRDAALHGADTCTRTRTLVQVKWCDAGIDPADPDQNPPVGTAKLYLQLREIYQSGDPCDPCSEEVPVDERIGNYLFRMEVHDVYEEAGAPRLVLKWSRENGAEQHPADDVPPGFDSGDWVWEYFDRDSENLAGRHFPAGERRRRGELVTTPGAPEGDGKPVSFVRRWDGYAILDPDAGTVLEGRDRGVELSDTLASEQHGWYRFEDGVWEANLEFMVCRLRLADAAFLAGDYWLAPVREAVHEPGSDVLGTASEPVSPQGIVHHYLVLGQTGADGRLHEPSDTERRQRHFPPLSDLRAEDVGFRNPCERLYADAENVQAALEHLCEIDARDIAYAPADCPDSVNGLLGEGSTGWPDRDADGRTTVGDILDGLLCDLDARHVPIDKSDLCPELAASDVRSVQDALERLCALQRDYCAIPVAPGELAGLLEAFAVDAGQTRLSLCLLPGDHPLPELNLADKAFLSITAAGDLQTRIVIDAEDNRLAVNQVRLQNFELKLKPSEGTLVFECNALDVQGCRFRRSGTRKAGRSLVQIRGSGYAPRCRWHDNFIQSTWARRVSGVDIGDLFPVDVVGERISDMLKDLQSNSEIVDGSPEYADRIGNIVKEVAALPAEERRLLGNNISGALARRNLLDPGTMLLENNRFMNFARTNFLPGLSLSGSETVTDTGDTGGGESMVLGQPDSGRMRNALALVNRTKGPQAFVDMISRDAIDTDFLRKGVPAFDALLGGLFESGVSPAITILDTGLDVTLQHNRIDGYLILANETKVGLDPVELGSAEVKEVPLIGDGRLTLQDCRLSRLTGYLEQGLVSGGTSSDGFHCFHTIQILDSTFDLHHSSAIAVQLDCRGNHFNAPVSNEAEQNMIWLRASQLFFTGNIGAAGEKAEAWVIADSRATVHNLMGVNLSV